VSEARIAGKKGGLESGKELKSGSQPRPHRKSFPREEVGKSGAAALPARNSPVLDAEPEEKKT